MLNRREDCPLAGYVKAVDVWLLYHIFVMLCLILFYILYNRTAQAIIRQRDAIEKVLLLGHDKMSSLDVSGEGWAEWSHC